MASDALSIPELILTEKANTISGVVERVQQIQQVPEQRFKLFKIINLKPAIDSSLVTISM